MLVFDVWVHFKRTTDTRIHPDKETCETLGIKTIESKRKWTKTKKEWRTHVTSDSVIFIPVRHKFTQ